MIKIVSADNKIFQVEEQVIFQSKLIKNMVSDLDLSAQSIPINNIDSEIMQKVIDYAYHHKDDTEKGVADEWDKEFFNLDTETIFKIILAANYLDMSNLLDLGCQTVADYIKDKPIEEITKILGLPDYVPDPDEIEHEEEIEHEK